MLIDPLKKCLLVDEDTPAGPLDYPVKTVALCVEDEVTEPPLGRPLVVVVPTRNWDETM